METEEEKIKQAINYRRLVAYGWLTAIDAAMGLNVPDILIFGEYSEQLKEIRGRISTLRSRLRDTMRDDNIPVWNID